METHENEESNVERRRKMYGYYECDYCGKWWNSAHSWADETQDCAECGNQVFPYNQEELQQGKLGSNANKPHREDLCGMCQKLGMSCTILMEIADQTRSKHQKRDLRVKGLPNDITEEKLRKMFASYGAISRICILKPNPDYPTRVAFITFDDPEAAIKKFKNLRK